MLKKCNKDNYEETAAFSVKRELIKRRLAFALKHQEAYNEVGMLLTEIEQRKKFTPAQIKAADSKMGKFLASVDVARKKDKAEKMENNSMTPE